MSGEQGIDSTTLSNHRTPSGHHGSGTAGFSTNSGTNGFSTNSTTGGRIGIRPKSPDVYIVYPVNRITGEIEESVISNDYTPERRPRSGLGPFGHTPDGWALSDILATDLAPPTTTIAGSRLLGRRTATRTALRRRLGRRTGVWPTRQTYPYGYPYSSPPLVCNETRGLIRGQLVTLRKVHPCV